MLLLIALSFEVYCFADHYLYYRFPTGKLGWSIATSKTFSTNATSQTLAFSAPTGVNKATGIVSIIPIEALNPGDNSFDDIATLSSQYTGLYAGSDGSR